MTQQDKWRCKYCDLGSNTDEMDFDREGLCRANPRQLVTNHTWRRVEETPAAWPYEYCYDEDGYLLIFPPSRIGGGISNEVEHANG